MFSERVQRERNRERRCPLGLRSINFRHRLAVARGKFDFVQAGICQRRRRAVHHAVITRQAQRQQIPDENPAMANDNNIKLNLFIILKLRQTFHLKPDLSFSISA